MKKTYKILTPAGPLYVATASEAIEYKKMYGYPYVRTFKDEENEV